MRLREFLEARVAPARKERLGEQLERQRRCERHVDPHIQRRSLLLDPSKT